MEERNKGMNNIKYALSAIDEQYISHFTNWLNGGQIAVMKRDGNAFCRLSFEFNSPDIVIIDSLSVDKDMRKRGIGNHILAMLENAGNRLGATKCRLAVVVGSFVHNWYKRCGYVDIATDEESIYVWMQKNISNK